jgi:hypothetical protein
MADAQIDEPEFDPDNPPTWPCPRCGAETSDILQLMEVGVCYECMVEKNHKFDDPLGEEDDEE